MLVIACKERKMDQSYLYARDLGQPIQGRSQEMLTFNP